MSYRKYAAIFYFLAAASALAGVYYREPWPAFGVAVVMLLIAVLMSRAVAAGRRH